jgi:hypothetical protein
LTTIATAAFQKSLTGARAQARVIERRLAARSASPRSPLPGSDAEALTPGGWFLAPYDPNKLLRYFPQVKLKQGYLLDSYQYLEGGNGNGFVFAVPEGRRLPPPPNNLLLAWDNGTIPVLKTRKPLPAFVRSDIEAYLEADGSTLSYFQCSLLIRELRELGAVWHGAYWSTHEVLVDLDPHLISGWSWVEKPPGNILPQVQTNTPGSATVQFYTYTRYLREQICRHTDIYADRLRVSHQSELVAEGGPGYIY